MTIEEAIRAIRHDLHWNLLKGYQEDVAKIAISALEKQMPKNPDRGVCPSCNSRHIYAATLMKAECFKYCGDCGQAIDWSDNDD